MTDVEQRIGRIAARWTFDQPILLAAFELHDLVESDQTETVRVGRRRIEFNRDYLRSLSNQTLEQIVRFEMVRVVLGHPYQRRMDDQRIAYTASNLAVQECTHSELPIPPAAEVFDDDQYSGLFFERYYRELIGRSRDEPSPRPAADDAGVEEPSGQQQSEEEQQQDDGQTSNERQMDNVGESVPEKNDDDDSPSSSLDSTAESDQAASAKHVDPSTGETNVELWDDDPLTLQEIDAAIESHPDGPTWGIIGTSGQELIEARQNPSFNHVAVMRRFRRTVTSHRRTLTRMRANRRYGLDAMGSRYAYESNLLLAIDCSGSMSIAQIQRGISIVRKLFRRGVHQIDLLTFDRTIRRPPLRLNRARRSLTIEGRGGTDFQCVIDHVSAGRNYDGVIIYTDGCAPPPKTTPANAGGRQTPLVWLLSDRDSYDQLDSGFAEHGMVTYLD